MTTELYKKYRPKSLDTIVGNETTVKTLQNMISRKTIPHTILISGPSGCGKTTLARILMKELECSELDFRELNCSDNRGIDTIRSISKAISLAPTGGKVRMWLLDESHMLTSEAQNAALKILEDTPKHVYFVLCTTDPQKIIPTIRTRCCHLEVELLNDNLMTDLINRVTTKCQESLDKDTLISLLAYAGGSARRALVALDRLFNLPVEQREQALKEDPEERETIELCRALLKREPWNKVNKILKGVKAEPETVRYAVLGYASAVLLNKDDSQAAFIIDVFSENFYDSKKAGLVRACHEAIKGE